MSYSCICIVSTLFSCTVWLIWRGLGAGEESGRRGGCRLWETLSYPFFFEIFLIAHQTICHFPLSNLCFPSLSYSFQQEYMSPQRHACNSYLCGKVQVNHHFSNGSFLIALIYPLNIHGTYFNNSELAFKHFFFSTTTLDCHVTYTSQCRR